jgi:hypothetical protein
MPPETGKQRRSRIELDYYRRPDALARWKMALGLASALLALGWLALAPGWNDGATPRLALFDPSRLASPGPVARAHAMLESSCESCHTPFQPINGSRWSPVAESVENASDAKCQACHAGPEHHAAQRSGDVVACAECHQDHQGRGAPLTSVDDRLCTSCHSSLDRHRDDTKRKGPRAFATVVTRFDSKNHPEFAKLADPGQLRFNHRLHLSIGLTLEPGGSPFTFARLPESERSRYGLSSNGDLSAPVRLDCRSCHVLDEAESEATKRGERASVVGTTPLRSEGAYMLPISSAVHCQACHPLHFEPREPLRQVRHGQQPLQVLEELRAFYATDALRASPELLRRALPARGLPMKAEDPPTREAGKAIDDKVESALRLLFVPPVAGSGASRSRRGCIECHEVDGLVDGEGIDEETIKRLTIRKVEIPRIWYPHARFDHSAHRSMDCASCHTTIGQSTAHQNLDIPGRSNCLHCHSADGVVTGIGASGSNAGSSCTTCHRYHNGDHPLEGPGASARGPRRAR